MFAVSQLILSKTDISKDNVQTYSIITGLVLYASVYLYFLYSNPEFLTFFNNFVIYIVLTDLLISGFMFYKTSKTYNKMDITNTDLVDLLESKYEAESEDENELESEDENCEEVESEGEVEIEHEIEDEIEEIKENKDENIFNIKDLLSGISVLNNQLNFENIDFNQIQNELNKETKIQELNEEVQEFEEVLQELEELQEFEEVQEVQEFEEVQESQESQEVQEVNNDEPIKKKRGRKPKKSLTEQLSNTLVKNKNAQITK